MSNQEIRAKIKESRIFHWEIAQRLGMSEFYFSRKLRNITPEFEKEILKAIKEIKKEV